MNSALVLVVTTLYILGASADPTCPKRDGKDPVYIPHEDCTKFWECSNGTPYLFNCSANLHFNPKLNVCDWPDQAGCVGGVDSGSSDSSGDGSSSGSSSESNDSEDVPTAPPPPPVTSEDSGSSGSSGGSGEGSGGCPAKDGEYPVYIPHEDCTKFWQCSNGVPYLFNCSANLHFNPVLNVCDWPDQAGCVGGVDSGSSDSSGDGSSSGSSSESNDSEEVPTVAPPPPPVTSEDSGSSGSGSGEGSGGCPAKDGEYPVYIPHEDCTKFWQCSNGVPYLFNCSANLHFNPVLNVCDWPDQAGCTGNGGGSSGSSESNDSQDDPIVTAPPAPPADDGDSSSSGSNENNGGNGGCPARDGEYPVYIPHEDCTKFWQCSNGVPYLFDCPANLHFNPKLNVCDWPLDAGCKGNAGNSSGGGKSSNSNES